METGGSKLGVANVAVFLLLGLQIDGVIDKKRAKVLFVLIGYKVRIASGRS